MLIMFSYYKSFPPLAKVHKTHIPKSSKNFLKFQIFLKFHHLTVKPKTLNFKLKNI